MEQIKIPPSLFTYFEQAGHPLYFSAGESIYTQGDCADWFYLIREGRVRAYYIEQNGRELTLEIVEKGRLIGESAFLHKSPRPASVNAVTDTKLLACRLEDLYKSMEESKELMIIMFQLMQRTCNHLSEQLRRVTLYSRYGKIASFLLHETTFPDKDRGVTPESIPYTHEELACCLGLNRVTVSRVLNEWKQLGLIETSYKKIKIKDREALFHIMYSSSQS